MTRKAGIWILLATILGSSMVFIDSNVVNVALPALQSSLNASATSVQWVVEAYILFLAALMLVGGSLGDLFGRRRIFAAGIIVFALASAWCGFAPNISQLIAARAVQGVGGALLTPGSLAIIRSSFPEEQRGRAIGLWSGFSAITAALGPALGGWLVQNASWRWVFFINVPIAIIVLAITFWRVPEICLVESTMNSTRLDWLGALLATTSLGGLVYGLIESNNLGFVHPLVIGTLSTGIIALIAFIIVELRSPDPMMPLTLFRSLPFSGTNLLTLLLYAAHATTFFFFPFDLIRVQGYSPTAAGAALLPFTLTLFLLSRWSGGLVKRYGAKLPLIVGPCCAALAFLLFAVPGVGGSYWTTFFPAVIMLGTAMAITIAPLTTTVLGAVDDRYAGVASGINNAVARIAGLLAIAVMSIFVLQTFNSNLDHSLTTLQVAPEVRQALDVQRDKLVGVEVPASVSGEMRVALHRAIDEAFIAGFRLIMLISAGLALASALCSLLMVPSSDKKSTKDREIAYDSEHKLREPEHHP